MSKVRIVTDRASDLPDNIAVKYGIEIAEMDVAFGEDVYYGGKGITIEDFYARMKKEKELPKTSCPSPDKFLEIYKKDDSDVLVLTLTSKLSATYNCAVLANDMYKEEEHTNRVKVMDTMSGSIGQGILAVYAAQLAEMGKNIDEIAEEVEKLIDNTKFIGVLQTLENAIKGGRINPLAGKLINALNFKAIIQVTEGVVKPIDKARGVNNSLKKVLEYVESNIKNVDEKILVIAHAHCEDKASKIKESLEIKYKFKDIIIAEIGPVMGTYTSQGAILISSL